MGDLKDKVVVVTGASRGIGEAIAVRVARDGAKVALLAKTDSPHPKLPGTVHTAAEAVEKAGGSALPCVVDVRDDEQVFATVGRIVDHFGGIDILVNNASALFLADTLRTPLKRFDLIHQVNVRATFACSQACIPHLKRAENPHILNLSPPLDMSPKWFAPHVAYTMSKYGMSMCVLGMAEELRAIPIAVNALWPRTAIATAAVKNLLGGEVAIRRSRKPEIVADAAYEIVKQPAGDYSGRFCIDDEVLRDAGVEELDQYAVDPSQELLLDLFVSE